MTGPRKARTTIRTALIADDHPVTRFGMLQFLRNALGVANRFEAEEFNAALDLLGRQAVDLAIFDLDMPGIDSPRALAQVRRQWPATRVVVLSGSERRADILEALEAGVHGYIVKSASMDNLAERLVYVMKGEIYVPPCLAEPFEQNGGAEGEQTAVPGPGPQLSVRQRQVLRGLVLGLSNKELCKELDLAEGTIKMHVGNVLKALGARSRSHAVSLGRRLVE